MSLEELKVTDLITLISALKGDKQEPLDPEENHYGVRIVVLQRGWVAVGYFHQKGEHCWLTKAATIRIWGTSGKAGLSYLAESGVTKDTILDKTPFPIRFHELTIVHMYDCKDTIWESIL